MATIYMFTLSTGATLHAGETSTIHLVGGTTKTPAEVVEGDQVVYAADASAVVTAINTAEV